MPNHIPIKKTMMNTDSAENTGWLTGYNLFRLFKYVIYILLSYNLVQFYYEDSTAALEFYKEGIALGDIIEAYSATIDTAAWIVLLFVFELETAILSDTRLKGWLGYWLTACKSICYAFILYSLYGYLLKFNLVTAVSPSSISDSCTLLNQGWTFIDSLNEYFVIDQKNCSDLNGTAFFQIDNTQILAHKEQIQLVYNLSAADVINAATWVLVVIMLQVEVILQLRNTLSQRILFINKWIKSVLYLILFFAAVYWGVDGSFLDFWDAFLWLLAFVFIDLNILNWHEEVNEDNKEKMQESAQA